MTELKETIKNNSKTQKDVETMVEEYSNEPYKTQT